MPGKLVALSRYCSLSKDINRLTGKRNDLQSNYVKCGRLDNVHVASAYVVGLH